MSSWESWSLSIALLNSWMATSVSWSASARESFAAWMTFWPTMMIGSSTNWRKVYAIQATMMIGLCEAIAAGSEIRVSAAKA